MVEELYILTASLIIIAVNIALIVKRVRPMEATFIGLFMVIGILMIYVTLRVSVVEVVSVYNSTTNTTVTKEIYGNNPFVTILLAPLIVTLGVMFYNIGRWIINTVEKVM